MHPETNEGICRPTERGQEGRLREVNVLFMLPSLGLGGAERQAFLLARHLRVAEGANVRMLGMTCEGAIATMAREAGIPAELFELRHGHGRRFGQVLDVVRFAWYLRRHRTQVLLPYCMFQNILGALAGRLGGVGACIWNQRDEGRSRVEPWVERLAVGRANRFVSNSQHGIEFLTAALQVPRGRVHLVHNGIEAIRPRATREDWRARLGIDGGAFVACMVANLHGFKDHATLVDAWRLVSERLRRVGREAHLLLAGAFGDRHAPLVAQVQGLGLAERVHFLGVVDDTGGLLACADLAVFSSYAEGVPNAILEAMAAGLAVAATDYPGIREAVGPEGTSLLARPKDAADLAARIGGAALDPDLRERLGRFGRERIRDEFGLDRMCRSMTDIVADTLTGDRR